MKVIAVASLDALSPQYQAFFADVGRTSFFLTSTWFEILIESTISAGEEVAVFSVEADETEKPLAMLVCRIPAGQEGSLLSARRPGARSIAGLTNFYTCHFDVLVASDVSDPLAAITALVSGIRSKLAPGAPLVFDFNYLPKDGANYQLLASALKSAGLTVVPYFHAGTWFEPVGGVSAASYLANRPKSIRQEYARKARKLEKSFSVEQQMYTEASRAEEALAAFQTVYQASWKNVERHPDFIPTLFRLGFASGRLRVGVLYIDGRPAAAQIYTLHEGVATAFKDAYDPEFSKHSPASVLRLFTVSYLIDNDRIAEINFGYGDEPYKQDWFTHRRELAGLLACDCGSWPGIKQIVWQRYSVAYQKLRGFAARIVSSWRRLSRKDHSAKGDA